MAEDQIFGVLSDIALTLDKCADDVPYELSAKENLYFRMVDMAKEARALMKDIRESPVK